MNPPGCPRVHLCASSDGSAPDQPLGESGDVGRRDFFERAQPDVAGDDGREAPVVGAAKRADARDAQLIRIELDGRLDRRAGGSGSRHAEAIPPP